MKLSRGQEQQTRKVQGRYRVSSVIDGISYVAPTTASLKASEPCMEAHDTLLRLYMSYMLV